MPARPRKKKADAASTPPVPVPLSITLSGFEDGVPYTDRPLTAPDRWAMQAADSLTVCLLLKVGGRSQAVELCLAQHPRALGTAKAGVGAVLWPGAVTLAAALVASHHGSASGGRLLELGAGAVGLPSLVAAAALGWAATATDRASVLPLLAANVASVEAVTGGRVSCAALDWSEAGAEAAAAALARGGGGGGGGGGGISASAAHPGPATLVAAADCVYEDAGDPEGSPQADAFVGVLVAAATAAGGCPAWVVVEPRSSAALEAFLAAAAARCASVTRLPPPVIAGDGWDLSHIHLYELRV